MYGFQLTVGKKALARILGCCGSLELDRPYYQDGPFTQLLSALTAEEMEAAEKAAQELVAAAVPIEGDPHPQRATAEAQGGAVVFFTPGDVAISINATDNQWIVVVGFGRDSKVLASKMLMAIITAMGSGATISVDEQGNGSPLPFDRVGRALARLLLRMDAESNHSAWEAVYGPPC